MCRDLCAASAQAQSLPRYDPRSYCREVANTIGGASVIQNSCIDQEQAAYDSLKMNWASIGSRTRSYCDEVSRTIGGMYVMLLTCIQQETSAASSKPGFKY